MADDATPLPPDQTELAARARKAGVDLDVLSDLARVRLLREFLTEEERAAQRARDREDIREDARLYNAHFEKHGFWNAHIKPW